MSFISHSIRMKTLAATLIPSYRITCLWRMRMATMRKTNRVCRKPIPWQRCKNVSWKAASVLCYIIGFWETSIAKRRTFTYEYISVSHFYCIYLVRQTCHWHFDTVLGIPFLVDRSIDWFEDWIYLHSKLIFMLCQKFNSRWIRPDRGIIFEVLDTVY